VRLEGLLPGRQRRIGRPSELGVDVPHQLEGVLVPAHPDVQAVLLDPAVLAAPAGALAAQPPAELVEGHALEALAPIGSQTKKPSTRRRVAPEIRSGLAE
jgi:hypothetical protein